MISLVDTHCHIQSIGKTGGERVTSEKWSKLDTHDIEEVIGRANQEGVNKLIAVGCDLGDSKLAIELAAKHRNIWSSIGIHPHEAAAYKGDKAKLRQFSALAVRPKVVAIGECGLDYYYTHSDHNSQKSLLMYQIELAMKHDLPLIFHVREAFNDFWPIFDNYSGLRGVLHSFTDSMANLEEALKRNLFIGVNGIATFTKDDDQTTMYSTIPLDKLVLETDAPFLTPAPFRGSINQPKNVRLVADYLARLRGQSLEAIATKTTENAQKLFSL